MGPVTQPARAPGSPLHEPVMLRKRRQPAQVAWSASSARASESNPLSLSPPPRSSRARVLAPASRSIPSFMKRRTLAKTSSSRSRDRATVGAHSATIRDASSSGRPTPAGSANAHGTVPVSIMLARALSGRRTVAASVACVRKIAHAHSSTPASSAVALFVAGTSRAQRAW